MLVTITHKIAVPTSQKTEIVSETVNVAQGKRTSWYCVADEKHKFNKLRKVTMTVEQAMVAHRRVEV